jgi:hypothetical protein
MTIKTHREVKEPKISFRFLADFMAASSTAQRSIVRSCKYPPIARLVQHNEAKLSIAKFIRSENPDATELTEKAQELRNRLADNQFDRDLFDHNADYLDRYAVVHASLALPKAEILNPGPHPSIIINGVKVSPELHFRFQRVTKSNEVKIGAGMLRYQKGKALSPVIAAWQSAILLGYLNSTNSDDSQTPEGKLCITVDAFSAVVHVAPTDAKRKFSQTESACETIAEWWQGIKPPPNAIL